MLRTLSMIAVGLVLLLVASISVLYALQPNSYRLVRSRTIPAARAAIRPCVVDLKVIDGWQVHLADPHDPPTVTFSPVTGGVGAWVERTDSRSTARTTIVDVVDNETESVVRLDHLGKGRFGSIESTLHYILRAHGAGTEVEYIISAPLSGLPRLLWPIADLERRVGPDMERALEQLETKCVNAAR